MKHGQCRFLHKTFTQRRKTTINVAKANLTGTSNLNAKLFTRYLTFYNFIMCALNVEKQRKFNLQVYDNTDWSMVESLNDTVDISNLYLQFTVQFAHTDGW